jgi:hypothetical protein
MTQFHLRTGTLETALLFTGQRRYLGNDTGLQLDPSEPWTPSGQSMLIVKLSLSRDLLLGPGSMLQFQMHNY